MTSNLRRGSRAIAVALLLAVGGVFAGIVGTLAVGLAVRSVVSITPTIQLGLFIPPMVLFVVVGAIYLAYRGLSLEYVSIRVPSLTDLLWTAIGYVTSIGFIIVASVILAAVSVDPDAQNSAASFGLANPELILWMIPIMLFVVGPCEEFLFRGVIQNRLKETFIPPVAIFITAAIFAPLHVIALIGDPSGKLIAISILFFPSLIFGIVYEKTGNLVSNALVHGIYNSTIVLMLYIVVKFGNVDQGAAAVLF